MDCVHIGVNKRGMEGQNLSAVTSLRYWYGRSSFLVNMCSSAFSSATSVVRMYVEDSCPLHFIVPATLLVVLKYFAHAVNDLQAWDESWASIELHDGDDDDV